MKRTNKEAKSISTPKKLLILFAVILAIFAIINAAWYFGYKATYNKYASKMDMEENTIGNETSTSYYKVVGDEKCLLSMPHYLGTGGFLSVGNKDGYVPQYDEAGNIVGDNGINISLYIYGRNSLAAMI